MYNHESQPEMLSQMRLQELMREADHVRLAYLAKSAKNQIKPNSKNRLPLFSWFGRASHAGANR